MKQQVYSVASLVHYMKISLDQDMNLQSILIKGEISNFTNHRSGHWYFTLKDAKAKINCVMFASYASRCKILLKEGMKVIVKASVSMYEAGGSVQLYVTSVQSDGLGDLYLQLEQVKLKLQQEGLFSVEHKKKLPEYPMRIGIITARTGAAIHDMLTTIEKRWPIAEVTLYPSLVQGSEAAPFLIEQLKQSDEDNHDVILLARGGGAIEDLWCFNDEMLARQVYKMKTVIITGVGHESDTTLVDYVSDARAATPTAAAQMATPVLSDVKNLIENYRKQLVKELNQNILIQKESLKQLQKHRYLSDPFAYIKEEQMRLAMSVKQLSYLERMEEKKKHQLQTLSTRMGQAASFLLTNEKIKIKEKEHTICLALQKQNDEAKHLLMKNIALLDAYSPLKVLQRGYAIPYKEGAIIKSVHDVFGGDALTLRLHDGQINVHCDYEEEEHEQKN